MPFKKKSINKYIQFLFKDLEERFNRFSIIYSHKNAAVRAEAAKLLAAIVERLGPNRSLSGAKDVTERLLPAAAVFIQDGNLEARYNSVNNYSITETITKKKSFFLWIS